MARAPLELIPGLLQAPEPVVQSVSSDPVESSRHPTRSLNSCVARLGNQNSPENTARRAAASARRQFSAGYLLAPEGPPHAGSWPLSIASAKYFRRATRQ